MEITQSAPAKATPNLSPTKPRKIYTGTAKRLMNLIATGATQAEASRACGVDESVTSAYLAEEDFKEQLVELVAANIAADSEIDQNYQNIELRLSKRLSELSELMMNPDQILRVLQFTNGAKKKVAPTDKPNGNPLITPDGTKLIPAMLVLPAVMTREFVLNPNNEVVGINGKPIQTLTSTGLTNLVEKNKQTKLQLPNRVVSTQNGSKQPKDTGDPYSDL